ncbi:MAG: hypothetical protein EPO26_18540 [Chloroflexota bacterium]|nr:MAG: hypothetical protein EPO26_18540 [Chloroflexota bacterium]
MWAADGDWARRATRVGVVAIALMGCETRETATGVLVDVRSSGLTVVESIALRLDDGTRRDIAIGSEIQRSSHPPSGGHLREHMVNGDRVTVVFRRDGAANIAISMEDGPSVRK